MAFADYAYLLNERDRRETIESMNNSEKSKERLEDYLKTGILKEVGKSQYNNWLKNYILKEGPKKLYFYKNPWCKDDERYFVANSNFDPDLEDKYNWSKGLNIIVPKGINYINEKPTVFGAKIYFLEDYSVRGTVNIYPTGVPKIFTIGFKAAKKLKELEKEYFIQEEKYEKDRKYQEERNNRSPEEKQRERNRQIDFEIEYYGNGGGV